MGDQKALSRKLAMLERDLSWAEDAATTRREDLRDAGRFFKEIRTTSDNLSKHAEFLRARRAKRHEYCLEGR